MIDAPKFYPVRYNTINTVTLLHIIVLRRTSSDLHFYQFNTQQQQKQKYNMSIVSANNSICCTHLCLPLNKTTELLDALLKLSTPNMVRVT